MFKNREVRVSVVKNNDQPETEKKKIPSFEDASDTVVRAFNRVIVTVSISAIGYVVIDTARQVLIAKATQPSTK